VYKFAGRSIAPTYQVLDSGMAVASFALVLVMMNLPSDVWGLPAFLETRLSLKNALILCSAALAWPWVFSAFGLYRFAELSNARVELYRIALACGAGSVFAFVTALTSASGAFGFEAVFAFWLTVTVGTAGARAVARGIPMVRGRLGGHLLYVVIVGTGSRALRLYQQLMTRPSYVVLGFVDTVAAVPLHLPGGPPVLGTLNDLEHILMSHPVDTVHIALPVRSCYSAIEQAISTCEKVGVESCYDADIFAPSRGRPVAHDTDLLVSRKVVADDSRLWIKRAMDIAGALIGLIVLSPVMLAAAIAVRLTSPGPAIFVQNRMGFNRRYLKMYKFRTMVADAAALQASLEALNEKDGPIFKIEKDPRVTSVGHFLRLTSIDELPQLWNVLKGEMSLVGPRPLPLRDVSRFSEASLMRRFSVKPGLTCLWQINGRSNTSFDRWIELDLEYIDRWSLALDLQILARTVPTVVMGKGAV
jgi:exopolysaccharide biosynthesis polyprenyl glycosylphosphotransferase